MKIHEALAVLRREVESESADAGRSPLGRVLNILGTDLEKAEVWAEAKCPSAESTLAKALPVLLLLTFGLSPPAAAEPELRGFYTAPFNLAARADAPDDTVGIGYATTGRGGTVTSITGCLYNDSTGDRDFTSVVSVIQNDQIIEAQMLTATYAPETYTCHELAGLSAEVEPGEYGIGVFFEWFFGENGFASIAGTSYGLAYDLEINGLRPPAPDVGGVTFRGLGVEYLIDEKDDPLCDDGPNGVVCLYNDRFEFTMVWDQNGTVKPVIFEEHSHQTALGFFNNLNDITVLLKVTNGCELNGHWWIWTGGATAGAAWYLQVRDTETGTTQIYTKPSGVFVTAAKDERSFPCW